MSWLLPLTSAVLFCVGFSSMRAGAAERQRRRLVAFSLRFPRQLPAEAVEAFWAGWTGSLPPWWKRGLLGVPQLVVEVRATATGIEHIVLVPSGWAPLLQSLLGAHLPSVRYERIGSSPADLSVGAEYRLSSTRRPLAVDAAAISTQLLSSLQPLGRDEVVVVQAVFGPVGPVQPARLAGTSPSGDWLSVFSEAATSAEAVSALKAKQSKALLEGILRIGVQSKSAVRSQLLLRRVEAAWHGTRAPGVSMRRRLVPSALAARRIARRKLHALGPAPVLLNAGELAGFAGFPIELDSLPGMRLSGSRLLPVPGAVPRTGTPLGVGTYPGTRRPVALTSEARTHHLHVVGPTGSGKSVLLARLALADLADRNRAVVVVDPKDGGLVDSILERLPEARMSQVMVLDPTDECPVGFDPLAATSADRRELVVDRVVSIMASIWKASWGPRSADLIRHALLTLTQVPGLTLCETAPLLTDARFRRSVLARLEDPGSVAGFWAWYEQLSPAERTAMVAAPLNKLRAFTSRSVVRHTLGQAQPTLDLDDLLERGGVLLVRLPAGLLGEETASLLGALVVTQLWQAIAARARMAPSARRPAMVILDEVQSLLRLPAASIEEMLTQARGYQVGLTLAHQHLHQLPSELRQTTTANTRTKVVFGGSRDDATVFAREFGLGLTPDDVMGLDAFEVLAAVYAEGRTQAAATVQTLPLPEAVRSAEVVRAQSRQRYGTPREQIESDLRARLNVIDSTGSGPVGRRRRSTP